MTKRNLIAVREAGPADAAWIASFLRAHWHATAVVAHGEIIDAALLPALIAGTHQGLATYRSHGEDAELITINAVPAGIGIGSALIEEHWWSAFIVRDTRAFGLPPRTTTCRRSDSYLRRGFRLIALRAGAVDAARTLKPSLPTIGQHGIPVHDEIELCRMLAPDEPIDASMRSPWSKP